MARLLHQQEACELLGFRDRRITVARPAWSKASHRVQTPIPADPKSIGEHVHKKRHELGLHQGQLANLMGVGKSTVSDWEANRSHLEGKVRDRVIAWLGFVPGKQN
jgi:ribosome-binding protein aMBF1 (putative translation factor)